MKKIFFPFIAIILLIIFSCNSQSDAQEKAKEIAAVTQPAAGEVKADANGAYMKAIINGKKWEATAMGPFYGPESNYKLVSGKSNEFWINFQIHKPTAGNKREFGNENVANLTADDDFFGGRKGEMTITKVDDKWVEGTFYFTAASNNSPKTFEVTNGVFRIPIN